MLCCQSLDVVIVPLMPMQKLLTHKVVDALLHLLVDALMLPFALPLRRGESWRSWVHARCAIVESREANGIFGLRELLCGVKIERIRASVRRQNKFALEESAER